MTAPEDKPFRIAIIGGGIGGLFAALSIHQYCSPIRKLQIDVYEQARAYREVGAGIGVGINASRLAHDLGLGEKLNKIAGRRKNVWITFRRYDNGEEVITVPLDDTASIRQAPVHRAEFLELLYQECIERGVGNLHVNMKCERLTENADDTVTLGFRDGTETTVDLCVGADGINSGIRGHFVKAEPVYCEQIAYRGVVNVEDVEPWWKLDTYSVTWVSHDRHLLVYPISANRKINVIAFVHVKKEDLGALKDERKIETTNEQICKDMAGFDEAAMRILKLLPPDTMRWKLEDIDPLDRWVYSKGKVVLLGDAAHPVLPHQGE